MQILAACKAKSVPVAVILINGGAVAIDPIVPAAPAIVEAFYPSVRGGEALTMMAFGETPVLFGKLPITMYDKQYIEQVDFHDFSMSKPPGRTYKYYTGAPLFNFGTGLTYAKHNVSCAQSLQKITCTGQSARQRWENFICDNSFTGCQKDRLRNAIPRTIEELIFPFCSFACAQSRTQEVRLQLTRCSWPTILSDRLFELLPTIRYRSRSSLLSSGSQVRNQTFCYYDCMSSLHNLLF